MSYIVTCKSCGELYESGSNRSGFCPKCKTNKRSVTNTKYRDKAYDRVYYYTPKGNRDFLKSYAKSLNMSLNEFITNAIKAYIEQLERENNTEQKQD
ncbi:MAG: hypothetical protein LUE12_00230 [Ruminococcus sp.]|nr:hypothetical protein [Ruminococcus sp.]